MTDDKDMRRKLIQQLSDDILGATYQASVDQDWNGWLEKVRTIIANTLADIEKAGL